MKSRNTALLLAVALVLGMCGCQTFSLTEEQFERQQHGQPADPETGQVVAAGGTVGFLGAMIGAIAAGAH